MRVCAASLLHSKFDSQRVNQNLKDDIESVLKRCAEVFFTSSGFLLFHCILCENTQLTDIKELCEHLTNEHQNVFEEQQTTKEIHDNEYMSDFKEDCSTEDLEGSNKDVDDGDINDYIEEIKSEVGDLIDEEFLSIVEYTITPAGEELNLNLNQNTSQDEEQLTRVPENKETEADIVEWMRMQRRRAGPRIKSKPGERRYICQLCGLAFKEAFNLRQHSKRHNKAERFKCTHCTKGFHTRTELDTHERRHRGDLPFMCEECGRRFVTSGALSQHMRRHLNLRPYKCDSCDKRFFDTSQLKHHYVVHTREREHTCTICNAKFARRKSLVTHMKIHANKREYVCKLCNAAFNQAPGLRMHLRNKHKDYISLEEITKSNSNF